MYTDFYNLKEKPFNLTPSSRFLYLGEVHKEALALLTYGVAERKGFILLTGEVGTGKTTMIQALLNNLDDSVQYVYLSNPLLSPDDFLKHLTSSALKKNVRFKTRGEVLLELEGFLRQCLQHQKNFVLIIDEAQKLSFDLLEEIRLLSNMESAEEKLINIFLIGQPEFNEKLSEPRCRPLLQRISIRFHIKPLDLKSTQEYIATRLKAAGAENGGKIFPKNVARAIHQYSEGYPRMINVLADNVLLLGYSREKKRITPAMIKECYEDLRIDNLPSETRGWTGKSLEPGKGSPATPVKFIKWVKIFFVVASLACLIGLTVRLVKPQLQRIYLEIQGLKNEIKEFQSWMELHQLSLEETAKKEELSGKEIAEDRGQILEDLQHDNTIASDHKMEKEMTEEGPPGQTVIVKAGDSLSKLAGSIYGRMDQSVLNLLKENNPDIENINMINVGRKIYFPPLPELD